MFVSYYLMVAVLMYLERFFSKRILTPVLRMPLMLFGLVLLGSGFTVVQAEEAQQKKPEIVDGFRAIEWTDLIPKEDLDALLNPPESLDDIADGSVEDQIASQMQLAIAQASDSRYQQALMSTQVIPAFDGQSVRVPGFIVPLEFGESEKQVTKFFLVPYFGACIHVPPPPPNQIIYAEFDKGFKLESLYDPFWLSGVIRTTMIENDMATAAYAIKVEQIAPYTE